MHRNLGTLLLLFSRANIDNAEKLFNEATQITAVRNIAPRLKKLTNEPWTNKEKQLLTDMEPISTRSHSAIYGMIHHLGKIDHNRKGYLNKEKRTKLQKFYLKWFKNNKLKKGEK